ncbi:MAG TPA: NrfD/PsrC family molybdoenzyme membrane anchor subunit [Candidatus Aquilonibacter sp.]|nr:NrfD/PsrC family molybdoenzyme membrane anchor subunit [Candidatus Aquilonibacter sp.]
MRSGERPSVPSPDDATFGAASRNGKQRAEIPTYYDRPMLKAPHWEWNVVTYLFLGGIMGGLGLIQLLAKTEKESGRKLKRSVRYTSFALAAANPAILITHLGRPERFLHMLRIVKFKSPMSLGVWGLVFYSGAAGANVVRELAIDGQIPRWLRFFAPGFMSPAQALLGVFTAGYTGVLLTATANPFWGSGKRHIPSASVASGLASACALSSLLCVIEGNTQPLHQLEQLEMIAGAAELLILTDFEKREPVYTKPFFGGARGKKLKTYTMAAGTLAPMALNLLGSIVKLPKPIDALRVAAASVLTLVGGYVLRESLIEAGKESARDPHAAFRQPQ